MPVSADTLAGLALALTVACGVRYVVRNDSLYFGLLGVSLLLAPTAAIYFGSPVAVANRGLGELSLSTTRVQLIQRLHPLGSVAAYVEPFSLVRQRTLSRARAMLRHSACAR